MKIEDDTIKFKSDPYFYALEKDGIKPNTVRILERNEGIEVDKWRNSPFIRYRYIKISCGDKSFNRKLKWFGKLGELLGKEIWMFCWKHPVGNSDDLDDVEKEYRMIKNRLKEEGT